MCGGNRREAPKKDFRSPRDSMVVEVAKKAKCQDKKRDQGWNKPPGKRTRDERGDHTSLPLCMRLMFLVLVLLVRCRLPPFPFLLAVLWRFIPASVSLVTFYVLFSLLPFSLRGKSQSGALSPSPSSRSSQYVPSSKVLQAHWMPRQPRC